MRSWYGAKSSESSVIWSLRNTRKWCLRNEQTVLYIGVRALPELYRKVIAHKTQNGQREVPGQVLAATKRLAGETAGGFDADSEFYARRMH